MVGGGNYISRGSSDIELGREGGTGILNEKLRQNEKALRIIKLLQTEELPNHGGMDINYTDGNIIRLIGRRDIENLDQLLLKLGKDIDIKKVKGIEAYDTGLSGEIDFTRFEDLRYLDMGKCTHIKNIILPNGIKEIMAENSGLEGTIDLSNCYKLSEADFRGCDGIEEVIVPTGKEDNVEGVSPGSIKEI